MADLKYQGMSRVVGRRVAGREHLFQSIQDILSTPIGTRVLVREYGSRLFELIDRPVTDEVVVDAFAAIAEALDRWEPRFGLTQVVADMTVPGKGTFDLYGFDRETGEGAVIEGVVV